MRLTSSSKGAVCGAAIRVRYGAGALSALDFTPCYLRVCKCPYATVEIETLFETLASGYLQPVSNSRGPANRLSALRIRPT